MGLAHRSAQTRFRDSEASAVSKRTAERLDEHKQQLDCFTNDHQLTKLYSRICGLVYMEKGARTSSFFLFTSLSTTDRAGLNLQLWLRALVPEPPRLT